MNETEQQWKIGELAAAAGLTVRALHYFDEIGLLSPSERSAAGHRRYCGADVRRLYRILALRELGMPLAKVAQVLDGQAEDLELVVSEHLAHVDRRLVLNRQLKQRLTLLLKAARTSRKSSIDQLIAVMEAMMEASSFSPDQMSRIKDRHQSGDDGLADWQQRVADLAAQVRTHIADGTDPAAPAAQNTAAAWSDFMDLLTDGDKGILSAMYAKLDNKGAEAATRGIIDTQVWDYVKRAFAVGYRAAPRSGGHGGTDALAPGGEEPGSPM
jgi:DNA-binding transcriptional MerR regulator